MALTVYFSMQMIHKSEINGDILKIRQLQELYDAETTQIRLQNQADRMGPGSAMYLFAELRRVA